ncbi:MAG: hypothetical protein FWE08_03875, partial [Oscillospiraceae bacterium]|nr:hypothetical protein [Oscillospiraceae bacterium]
MNLKPMRPGMPYSPETELREAIGPLATEIPIVDPEALPPAPNDAVIGTRAVGETISYTGKVQHGDGWRLTGVQRAVETGDVARTWNAGAPISRVITERDFAAIRENILSLCDEIEGGASPTGPPRVIHVALWHRSQHAPIQDHQLILTFERPTPAGHWVGF